MTTATTNMPQLNKDLFDHLLDTYREPLNRNCSTFWPDESLRVDDQNDGDVARMFCTLRITVSTTTPNEFQLDIRNSPNATEVLQLIEDHDGEVTTNDKILRAEAKLTLATNNVTYLRQLARAYRRTTGRGTHYLDANWKWVCKRTAKSLDRLADTITEFRKQRHHD